MHGRCRTLLVALLCLAAWADNVCACRAPTEQTVPADDADDEYVPITLRSRAQVEETIKEGASAIPCTITALILHAVDGTWFHAPPIDISLPRPTHSLYALQSLQR